MGTPQRLSITTRIFRGVRSPGDIAHRLLDLGLERLVLDAELRQPEWERIHDCFPSPSAVAAFLFAPLPPATAVGRLPLPSLAAVDPDEWREAWKRCRRWLEHAERQEISTLIVPPPVLDHPPPAAVEKALRGKGSPEALEFLRRERQSVESYRRQLDSFLGILSRLLEAADSHGLRIALIPGGFPCELPDESELRLILTEFSGAPAMVYLDLVRLQRAVWSGQPVGAFLKQAVDGLLIHDGDAFREHRPLGEGQVELERLKEPGFRPMAAAGEWIVDLQQGTSYEALAATRRRLDELFETPKETPSPFLDTSLRDLV